MTTSTLDADVIFTDSFDFDSSSVDVAFYDEVSGNLFVQFLTSGTLYQYGGVPVAVWEDFKNASSPGQFYAFSIKGHYARGIEVNAYDATFEEREVPVEPVVEAVAKTGKTLVITLPLSADAVTAAHEIVSVIDALLHFEYEAEVV